MVDLYTIQGQRNSMFRILLKKTKPWQFQSFISSPPTVRNINVIYQTEIKSLKYLKHNKV